MSSAARPGDPASELRRAFDHAFAVAPETKGEQEEALIAIRIGGQPYALRRRQILGVARMRRLVPVSSPISTLAGITGLRGLLIPVFRLAGFVDSRGPVKSPQWLALVDAEGMVGLAFDEFEGQSNVPAQHLYQQEHGPESGPVRQAARIGTAMRPIVEVPLIVEQVRAAADAQRNESEES